MSKHEVNKCLRAKGLYKASATYKGKTERNILVGYSLTKKDIEPPTDDSMPF